MPGDRAARLYEIRVRGCLGELMLTAFEPLCVHFRAPGETLLRCDVSDQSALHGVLAQIESLGLELLELRQIPRV